MIVINKKTLGDITEFVSTGKTPPTKIKEYFTPEINWYTPGDFKGSKYLKPSIRKISTKAVFDKKGILYPTGTVLITCIGNIGNVGILETESSCNQQITALKPKAFVSVDFLYYWFVKHKYLLENKCNNAVVPILNNKNLKAIKINYIPPLPQQKHIVSILDQAQALKANIQAQLEDYEKMGESLFLEMFGDPVVNPMGWESFKLQEMCSKITDGTHKTPKYQSEGVIFLSAKNIKKYELNQLNPKYISEEEHKQLTNRCKVERGDILITKSGSLGMAAKVNFEFEFSIFESLALIKYYREKINGDFLLFFLNTPSTQYQYKRMTKGVGVKHLHLKDLRNLKLICPPLELQKLFNERILNIQKQKQTVRVQLKEAEDLFQKLLQMAFKGELTEK